MRAAVVFRVLGVLLTLFSVTMLVPAGVSLLYRDGTANAFLLAFAITLVTGLACWLPTRKQAHRIADSGWLFDNGLVLGRLGLVRLLPADAVRPA